MFYTAPTDMIRPISAHFGQTAYSPISIVNEFEFQQAGGNDLSYGSGTPAYLLVDKQGTAPVFRLWPPPTSTSATSTLSAAITDAAAASIDVTTASTSLRGPAGWVSIDSEKIIYQNISATQILLARRGEAGTTAATHTNGSTVTQLDLLVTYVRQPTAVSVDADIPEINTQHHYYLAYGAAAMALAMDGRDPSHLTQVWEEKKQKAKREIARRRAASPSFILMAGI